ncbi:alpha/beta fold hydrolase [Ornithinimicrobium sp. LYQ103]|uniref:alpha/beta fold hydrolase n=1 Tax=Ornithinimicrobium sp. LYQ103 TaxID=3378796 RepID=UPI00385224B8
MSDSRPRPRLVLVHGTRMNAAQWEPYRPLLPGVELVAVDLPGHGSRVGEEFTADAAVATLEVAVDGRAPGQPVVLAGHSLGGYMAMLYAARHPDVLDVLVLLGATADPRGPLTGVYRGFARAVPLVGAERMARAFNAVMRGLGARGEFADALPDGSAYAALPAAWEVVMGECGPALLADVECPVVMVNGGLDQMRLHVRRFAAAAREPYVVTIPGATHLMPSTHPEQVAGALLRAVGLAEERAAPPTMDR